MMKGNLLLSCFSIASSITLSICDQHLKPTWSSLCMINLAKKWEQPYRSLMMSGKKGGKSIFYNAKPFMVRGFLVCKITTTIPSQRTQSFSITIIKIFKENYFNHFLCIKLFFSMHPIVILIQLGWIFLGNSFEYVWNSFCHTLNLLIPQETNQRAWATSSLIWGKCLLHL